jgi:hypothetical protein
MAHAAAGEDRLARAEMRRGGGHVGEGHALQLPQAVAVQVLGGQHGEHAGGARGPRGVDPCDAGVRMR